MLDGIDLTGMTDDERTEALEAVLRIRKRRDTEAAMIEKTDRLKSLMASGASAAELKAANDELWAAIRENLGR